MVNKQEKNRGNTVNLIVLRISNMLDLKNKYSSKKFPMKSIATLVYVLREEFEIQLC